MAKRGFFAELQYQNQLAEKRRLQAERAAAQLARSTAADQKAAERESKRLHQEARLAKTASLNAKLETIRDELDSLLVATLDVDDFVIGPGAR